MMRPLVDVGAGNRLIIAGLAHTSLQPVLDFGDYSRADIRKKLEYQVKQYNRSDIDILPDTLQEYTERVYPGGYERPSDTIFNFTDSIYYISDDDLYWSFKDLDDGTVAVGTLHVFDLKSDGILKVGEDIFGHFTVNSEDQTVCMSVKGNAQSYNHKIRFPELLTKNVVELKSSQTLSTALDSLGHNFVLTVICEQTFNYGGTHYKRFKIIKTPKEKRCSKSILEGEVSTLRKVFAPVQVNEQPLLSALITTKEIVEVKENDAYILGETTVMKQKDNKLLAFTEVKGSIRAVEVLRPMGNIGLLKNVRSKLRAIRTGEDKYSFKLETSIYNKIVELCLKATKINRETIIEILLAASVRTNGADCHKYLVPILASAFKTAFRLETKFMALLDSDLLKFLNSAKDGKLVEKKNLNIFWRFANYFFGSVSDNLDELQNKNCEDFPKYC